MREKLNTSLKIKTKRLLIFTCYWWKFLPIKKKKKRMHMWKKTNTHMCKITFPISHHKRRTRDSSDLLPLKKTYVLQNLVSIVGRYYSGSFTIIKTLYIRVVFKTLIVIWTKKKHIRSILYGKLLLMLRSVEFIVNYGINMRNNL